MKKNNDVEMNISPVTAEADVANVELANDATDVTTAAQGGEAAVAEVETYKEISPVRLVARRFFRSKLSIVGLVMIVFLFAFSFLGPVFFADFGTKDVSGNVIYDPNDGKWGHKEVDRSQPLQTDVVSPENPILDANGNVVDVFEEVTYPKDLNRYARPSKTHLLGTDDQGRDVFVRLMYGGRISLLIGFIVVILETIVGVIFGGIAGHFGGWADQIIMRVVDIFNCVPTLPILLIASALIESLEITGQIQPESRIYLLMVIITVFGWAGTARMVRGQILSLREQEFITATEVMGFSNFRKIFVHLIPNVMPQLIVSMTLGLGGVIMYESTLSYLGLGVPPGQASWGQMIALSNNRTVLENYTFVWLPAGILIVIAVLGFNFIGDGLRDAMDPKAKK